MSREETIQSTKKLLLELACRMVDTPELVQVASTKAEEGVVMLHLSAAKDDLGKLIGQQGRTARAIRTILAAVSATCGVVFTLDILKATEV